MKNNSLLLIIVFASCIFIGSFYYLNHSNFNLKPAVFIAIIIGLLYLSIKNPIYLLWLTLVAVYIPYKTINIVGLMKVTLTQIVGFILLLSIIINKNKITENNKEYLKPAKYAVLSIIWGTATLLFYKPSFIISWIFGTFPSIVLMVCIIYLIDDEIKLEKTLLFLCIGLIVNAVISLKNYSNIKNLRLSGLIGNPNLLAQSLIVGISISLIKVKNNNLFYKKIIWSSIILLFIIAFSFAASRSASIGLIIIIFGLYLWVLKKSDIKTGLIIVLISIAIIYFAPVLFWDRLHSITHFHTKAYAIKDKDETVVRQFMYIEGWKLFIQRPLWGWGAMRYQDLGTVSRNSVMHSRYLAILCEQGLIGFFFYIGIYLSSLKYGLRTIRLIGLQEYDQLFREYILIWLGIGTVCLGLFTSMPYDKNIFIVLALIILGNKIFVQKQENNKIKLK
jgi:O-antigen ligase